MNCPSCKSADVRPGMNDLYVCRGCGVTIVNYFPPAAVAPVSYGKRYYQIKFTVPPPVAPEFYEQLTKEADAAINAEIQRQEQAISAWGPTTAKVTVASDSTSAGIFVSPANSQIKVRATTSAEPLIEILLDSGATYDGLTATQCLERYVARQQDGRWVGGLTAWQLDAARDLWSAQLRAKVLATSKPKLTVMVQVDCDE